MIDNLDFGARDSYPSRYNYNYDSSMYLDSASSPQGAARAYTEDTRPDKMEGCEPCRGFSSIYYDKCYAKEGNQCIRKILSTVYERRSTLYSNGRTGKNFIRFGR